MPLALGTKNPCRVTSIRFKPQNWSPFAKGDQKCPFLWCGNKKNPLQVLTYKGLLFKPCTP